MEVGMAMLTVALSSSNSDVVQAIVVQDALPSSKIPIQSKNEVKYFSYFQIHNRSYWIRRCTNTKDTTQNIC